MLDLPSVTTIATLGTPALWPAAVVKLWPVIAVMAGPVRVPPPVYLKEHDSSCQPWLVIVRISPPVCLVCFIA